MNLKNVSMKTKLNALFVWSYGGGEAALKDPIFDKSIRGHLKVFNSFDTRNSLTH